MTLQELHELTGKVLKESPELATKEVCVTAGNGSKTVKVLTLNSDLLWLLNESETTYKEDVILWQAN